MHVHALIVEDSEADAELLVRELQRGDIDPDYEIVATPQAMAAALEERPWDVVIADYVMPHFSGLDAFKLAREKSPDTPMIIVSGKIDEEVAVAAMLTGAKDYVLKNDLKRLVPAVRREIRDVRLRERAEEARRHAEDALRHAYEESEQRIAERTNELLEANVMLGREVSRREQVEQSLRESDRRFRALVAASSDVLYRMSPDWSEMRWLRSQAFLSGTNAPTGSWIEKYIPEEERPRVLAAIEESIRNGSVFELEHRVVRQDGAVGWTFSRAVPVLDAQGEIIEWFGAASDITERKRAEDAAAEARADAERRAAEFQSFVASMADGVAVWNADGDIVFVNEACRQMLGVPPDVELETVSHQYELFTLDGEPIPEREWGSRRALNGQELRDLQVRIVTPWKEAFISYSAAPILNSAGDVIGATSVIRDVRDQLETEHQRRDLYEREHHIAQVLQRALVPPMASMDVSGCSVALKYEPALAEAEVGGDFYDVFELSDDRVGIVIGDVAGKGLDAAVSVAAAKHAIRSYAYIFDSPAQAMKVANEALCKTELGYGVETNMLTALLVIIDVQKGTMTCACAGHEPPIVRRADGAIEEVDCGGIALGIACVCEFEDYVHSISPGDTVVVVTDGITEARTSGANLFGREGVKGYLARNPEVALDDIPSGLLEEARSFAGGQLRDDAAIVAFQCCSDSPTCEK